MNFYDKAVELYDETVENRRYLHKNAEVGLHLPKAHAYVMEKLKEYGFEPQECGEGITVTLGKGGSVLLLRADMDALPMPEESGVEFACPTGKEDHACGHDLHTAMLLTAAKMLKEQEEQLKGTIKFMFQPAEETFQGSINMIEHGILENPRVDAAMALHVAAGKMPIGVYMYNSTGTMMSSVDGFRINIKGQGSHGAYPNKSHDPIQIGVQIYIGLETLIAREVNPEKTCVLTVGRFQAGTAANIIPDTAVLEGTIRTNDKESRELLVRRMKEMAHKIADAYGGSSEVEMISGVPSLRCDKELTEEMVSYIKELNLPGATPFPNMTANASEDFANIAERVPSVFLYVSAGFQDERGDHVAHNPKVIFNEEVCKIGPAIFAHCAMKWLSNHSNE